ncbi:hypothetical protein [Mesorhizobium sp. LSHC412B00]|nr:hypothetical protein [Mesorhizobium sp. LSHC412B00]ESX81657.1 hypothetical protein X756_31755 [Mesorhizobium sp. LSHC412B00]
MVATPDLVAMEVTAAKLATMPVTMVQATMPVTTTANMGRSM